MKAARKIFFALILSGSTGISAETDTPDADEAQAAPPPLATSVTLSAPIIPTAPPKQMEIDVPAVRAKYPNLLKIHHFSTVDVVIIGSKRSLGLKENELNDFAVYCFGQLFKNYDFKPLGPGTSSAATGDSGTLNVIVNTYPMATSCELRMGTVGSANTWVTNEFRVSTSNSTVKDARLLKTMIATMMAKAAYTLRKTQGL